MDKDTREEIEKLQGMINDWGHRVVTLEAQTPFIKEALTRIEASVSKLSGHIVKALWGVLLLFGAYVVEFIVRGGLHIS